MINIYGAIKDAVLNVQRTDVQNIYHYLEITYSPRRGFSFCTYHLGPCVYAVLFLNTVIG